MINLLSQETKKEVAAAQRNVTIRRYIITALILILIIVGVFGVKYYLMMLEQNNYKATIEQKQPEKAKYAPDVKRAAEFTANLKTAKSILSNELLFSEILTRIAYTLPPGAALTDITLDIKKLDTANDLNIGLGSYEDAIKVKNAFENSEFFKDAQIKTITKNEIKDSEKSEGSLSQYPFKLVLAVTPEKDAFLKAQSESSAP